MKNNKDNTYEYYENAILIRETEKRLLDEYSKGKISGTIHTCLGQELIGATFINLKSSDIVFSNHRCHGHYIGKTGDYRGLINEILGNSEGASKGMGGSQHLFNEKGFYSNGILSGMSPISAGRSFSLKKSNSICVLCIGDGATAEGSFFESLNLIKYLSVPLLIVLEDNGVSQSTYTNKVIYGKIENKIKSFEIDYKVSDIWNSEKFFTDMNDSFDYIRKKRKPLVIHIKCFRLHAHSKGDDIRDKKIIEKYQVIDPINKFEKNSPDKYQEYKKNALSKIDKVFEDISKLKKNSKIFQINKKNNFILTNETFKLEDFSNKKINELIYNSLNNFLDKNKLSIFIGEDIEDPYGGAFKISRDLSSRYQGRVFNMPNCEASIVGFCTGYSMSGNTAICEIMFGDFMTLVFDQWVNHASKFKTMYGRNIDCNLIIRTPMGGRRGYGPTHSQNLEKYFSSVPNTNLICLNFRYDPSKIYEEIFKNIDRPTIIIENKLDYFKSNKNPKFDNYKYFVSNRAIPELILKNKNTPADFTMVCWGGLLEITEEIILNLWNNEEISCELIVLQDLININYELLNESCKKSQNLVILEDENNLNSIGTNIISQISKTYNNISFHHFSPNVETIPSSSDLEKIYYIDNNFIYTELKRIYLEK